MHSQTHCISPRVHKEGNTSLALGSRVGPDCSASVTEYEQWTPVFNVGRTEAVFAAVHQQRYGVPRWKL